MIESISELNRIIESNEMLFELVHAAKNEWFMIVCAIDSSFEPYIVQLSKDIQETFEIFLPNKKSFIIQ